jgi:hypothetical protein
MFMREIIDQELNMGFLIPRMGCSAHVLVGIYSVHEHDARN